MKPVQFRVILISTIPLILLSHLYLDTIVAGFFGEVHRKNALLSIYSSDIPDLLFPAASLFTAMSWAAYYSLSRRGIDNASSRFFLLTGCTVPLSFLSKTVLKYLFGKVTTRAWLAHNDLYGFHWFNSGEKFSGFPSGHMVVFTVLALGVIRFFPRYRRASLGFLFLLAAALIITDYHFLSDVGAGTLLGFMLDAGMYNLLFLGKRKQ